jgi:spermidine synthase
MKSRIVGGTVLIVAFLSWQSSNYATVFQNQETLWRNALQRNPAAWAGHCNLGGVELERGNLEAAGQHIQEAARLAPQVAETHYNLALWHLRAGHPIEAAKAAEEAVRLGPSLARHHSVWILARLQSGQLAWADAVKDYETLLQLEPDNAAALNNFSMALISAGQFERASQASEHSIALAPDNIEYLNTLALTQSATRHYPQAIATYRKALALKSDHVSTLIGLAWLLATNEVCSQPEEAVHLAEKAVSLTSRHDLGAFDTLAAACAAAGKFPQAVQHAETALSIAQAAGQVELQKECTARLALYREGRPYREERVP